MFQSEEVFFIINVTMVSVALPLSEVDDDDLRSSYDLFLETRTQALSQPPVLLPG